MSPPSEATLSPLERALGLAYRYVDRRERTVGELSAHLSERGVEECVAGQAVAALQEGGLIDDARFARLFVEDKRALDGWGTERITRTLRKRGVNRDDIAAALAAGDGLDDERERALTLLRRRWPDPPVDPRARERALGVLLRKGYESELALDVLDGYIRSGSDAD
jgi:regulatory protein